MLPKRFLASIVCAALLGAGAVQGTVHAVQKDADLSVSAESDFEYVKDLSFVSEEAIPFQRGDFFFALNKDGTVSVLDAGGNEVMEPLASVSWSLPYSTSDDLEQWPYFRGISTDGSSLGFQVRETDIVSCEVPSWGVTHTTYSYDPASGNLFRKNMNTGQFEVLDMDTDPDFHSFAQSSLETFGSGCSLIVYPWKEEASSNADAVLETDSVWLLNLQTMELDGPVSWSEIEIWNGEECGITVKNMFDVINTPYWIHESDGSLILKYGSARIGGFDKARQTSGTWIFAKKGNDSYVWNGDQLILLPEGTQYASGFNGRTIMVLQDGQWKLYAQSVNQTIYRVYNPNSGEHFYTSQAHEKEFLVNEGWKDEGIAFETETKAGKPVYRLYNPNASDHHFTMDAHERDVLEQLGWNYEGVAWYSGNEDCLPVYRLYNPNAISGSHHYTPDAYERQFLINEGWKDEGISFWQNEMTK